MPVQLKFKIQSSKFKVVNWTLDFGLWTLDCKMLRLALSFLFLALFPPSFARAHRLEAEAMVRPFGVVQVETWFETGDSPRAAQVKVFLPDGRVLMDGRCDERGIFAFDYDGSEPLRIVVNAGAGHRAEATVSRAMLANQVIYTVAACLAPPPSLLPGPLLVPIKASNPPAPLPIMERNAGTPIGRLAVGAGLLLAIAAAVLIRQRLRPTRGDAMPAETAES